MCNWYLKYSLLPNVPCLYIKRTGRGHFCIKITEIFVCLKYFLFFCFRKQNCLTFKTSLPIA
ncbi:hypothetical protein D7Y25_20390 [Parabacteroides goldsteinii]|nr:hypothetical protein [Parabacteroides goldsteinii]NDO66583.1 hypothetical protein [Parabacteroides goldsteinii]RLT83284.1 hypothetical protein D7Y25_20390 [Parabacteroides goldsteinii]TFU69609.1 hypothetical protein E4T94_21865 [Parabacteroides sp. P14]